MCRNKTSSERLPRKGCSSCVQLEQPDEFNSSISFSPNATISQDTPKILITFTISHIIIYDNHILSPLYSNIITAT